MRRTTRLAPGPGSARQPPAARPIHLAEQTPHGHQGPHSHRGLRRSRRPRPTRTCTCYRDTSGPDAEPAAPDLAEPDAAYWYDLLAEARLSLPRSIEPARGPFEPLLSSSGSPPGAAAPPGRPPPAAESPPSPGCHPRSGPRRFRARAGAQARADQGPVPDRGSDRRAQCRQALRSSAGPATGLISEYFKQSAAAEPTEPAAPEPAAPGPAVAGPRDGSLPGSDERASSIP